MFNHIIKFCTILACTFTFMLLLTQAIYANQSVGIPSYQKIPLLTLDVKKYSELELKLQSALLQGDMGTINSLISPTFQERDANNLNLFTRKEDWVSKELNHKSQTKIEQMSVHAIGDVYIVSYVTVSNAVTKSKHFIVDVWQQKKNTLLMLRYKTSTK